MEPTEEQLNRMLSEDYASRTDEILGVKNPYHRIGTLEGAIKAALPYFEKAVNEWELHDKIFSQEYCEVAKARQVIANLKGIINDS